MTDQSSALRAKFKARQQQANQEPESESSRGLLFGTGITKKVVAKQQAQERRDDKKLRNSFADLMADKPEPTPEVAVIKPATDSPFAKVVDDQRFEQAKDITPDAKQDDRREIQFVQLETSDVDSIVLDEYQEAALQGLLKQRYGCLIGRAGTGKTTLTKKLVQEVTKQLDVINLADAGLDWQKLGFESEYAPPISFSSFTGRAVQQMKRALPKEYHPFCQTVHKTLAFKPVFYEDFDKEGNLVTKMRFEPTFHAGNRMPYKVYFVDETGMLQVPLWNQFLDAMPDDARIILIGDINQLPPVMGHSVLGYAMLKWPTFELAKIHRQAEGDPIIENSHRIIQGMRPHKVADKFDIITVPDGSLGTFQKLIKMVKWLHQKGQFDPVMDAIIVPQNKDTLGQEMINENLVNYFNAERKDPATGLIENKRHFIHAGKWQHMFSINDKIMLLQNQPNGLTNGMIGIIEAIELNSSYNEARADFERRDIDHSEVDLDALSGALDAIDMTEQMAQKKEDDQRQASHITTVLFQDGQRMKFNTTGDYANIAHAYAFTCHKSQGGEYPTVIVLCHSANAHMLNREWLYTAVTRARERVILFGNERGIMQALGRQRIKGQTLEQKAQAFLRMLSGKLTSPARLPEPEEI